MTWKYKTKICKRYDSGSCVHGSKCMHAHGMRELRSYDNPLYKAQMCSAFTKKGFCKMRQDCMFAHQVSELRSSVLNESQDIVMPRADGVENEALDQQASAILDPKYKTKLCLRYEQTQMCFEGDSCPFAHGEAELRSDPTAVSSPVKSGLYKTSLCNNYVTLGVCPAGNKCTFAHGKYELRPVGFKGDFNKKVAENSKWKCTLCKSYVALGRCERANCQFAHGVNELRSEFPDKPDRFQRFNYKTSLCIHYEEDGHCNLGADCKFAHGVHELRPFANPFLSFSKNPPRKAPSPAIPVAPVQQVAKNHPSRDEQLFLEFLEFKKFKQQFESACAVSPTEVEVSNICGGGRPRRRGVRSEMGMAGASNLRLSRRADSDQSFGSSDESGHMFPNEECGITGRHQSSPPLDSCIWSSDLGYYSRSASRPSPEGLQLSIPPEGSPFLQSTSSPSDHSV